MHSGIVVKTDSRTYGTELSAPAAANRKEDIKEDRKENREDLAVSEGIAE